MKITRLSAIYLWFLFLTGVFGSAQAQRTQTYVNKSFKDAFELFDAGKYGAAQQLFDNHSEDVKLSEQEKQEAQYYGALCAYHLFNGDAGYRLRNFIESNPESQYTQWGYFYMGNIEYRNKSYRNALEWFNKTDATVLNKEQRFEYNFKKAYCLFLRHDHDKSQQLFSEVMDVENKFAAPATYYYAHIAYLKGNYETALKGFSKFEPSSPFYSLIPYYTAQILYMQKKYKELVDYTAPWIDSVSTRRLSELAHIMGDAYFKLKNYDASLKMMKKFMQTGGRPVRSDHYQIAYAEYLQQNYPEAIRNYQFVIKETDSLTQLGYYQLADCYLKSGNKAMARGAFESASAFNFYPDLAEDALFSYARLSYELSYNPFHEAITAFERYIERYPNSAQIDDAYKYLVQVYMGTRNYKDALTSIEKIKEKTPQLNNAYQKIIYFRAIELFNDGSYPEAAQLFRKSASQLRDKNITAMSNYWYAESIYRQGKYEEAVKAYADFMESPGASLQKEYRTANYHIGYAYFKMEQYEKAAIAFRKFMDDAGTGLKKLMNDAYLRTGDCYYVTRDYARALDYYHKAVTLGVYDKDYALYQKAGALGLLGKVTDKISVLNELLVQTPSSAYADDALYELGTTYFNRSDFIQSLEYFSQIKSRFPSSNLVQKAMLKTALVYYNTDRDKEAIAEFKQVIEKFPSSQESREAVTGLRNLYVETGDIASFEDFVRSKPGMNFSAASLDSAHYETAEKKFMAGQMEQAAQDFKQYLSKFPEGIFNTHARYYLAESILDKSPMEALAYYQEVAAAGVTRFRENAVYKSAELLYSGMKWEEALGYYNTLETVAEIPQHKIDAQTGIMRCNFKLGKAQETIDAAARVLRAEKSGNIRQTESLLLTGKSYAMLQNDSAAQRYYRQTAVTARNEAGAEAHYLLCEMLFRQKEHAACEKEIFSLIDRVPSYDLWIARSFILLADNYEASGDRFQAAETLKSIIEKCEIPELVQKAQEKLNKLNEASEKAAPGPENNTPEVELNEQDQTLFDNQPRNESQEDQ